MALVAQALTTAAIDQMILEVAPQDVQNAEVQQFKLYLQTLDSRQLHSIEEEMKGATRVRARKIILREQLLSRLGTDWLRKHQEIVENKLASLEIAKDTVDFNILELELSAQSWKLGKIGNVLHLDERAGSDPLIGMIKHRESEDEEEHMNIAGVLDDDRLDGMFSS